MSARPGLRSVLREPGYRRLFAAQTVSRWGDTFNTVALAVLVFDLTGSGVGVAAVVVAEVVPVLLLAPAAGVLIDRLPRVRVMIAADLWRVAAAAVLPLAADSIVAVYAVAFALAAGAVFFNPAAQSVVPNIVEEDELVAANSGLWSAAVVSQIALAPLAGLVVAWAGPGPAFLLNAATFAASALVLRGLRLPVPAADVTAPLPWRVRLTEAAGLFAAQRLLRTLAAVQVLAALSAGATSALLVVLAERHLGVGADGFGLLIGAIGVGAALGPLLLARLSSNPRRPGLVFGPLLLRGAVDFILAAFTSMGVAVAALAAYGVGTSTGAVTFNSLLQAETPAEQRGRVFAGFDALWQAGRLVSLGLGGVLADALGVRVVYYLGGALLLLAGTGGLVSLRALSGNEGKSIQDG
jgi:MFS family permease